MQQQEKSEAWTPRKFGHIFRTSNLVHTWSAKTRINDKRRDLQGQRLKLPGKSMPELPTQRG